MCEGERSGETVESAVTVYSGTLSQVSRQIGFAGIAAIWAFRETGAPTLGHGLVKPLCLIVGSLLLNVLHYLVGTVWFAGLYVFTDQGPSALRTHTKAQGLLLGIVMLEAGLMIAAYVLLLWELGSRIGIW
jgi:hypothetical protein